MYAPHKSISVVSDMYASTLNVTHFSVIRKMYQGVFCVDILNFIGKRKSRQPIHTAGFVICPAVILNNGGRMFGKYIMKKILNKLCATNLFI